MARLRKAVRPRVAILVILHSTREYSTLPKSILQPTNTVHVLILAHALYRQPFFLLLTFGYKLIHRTEMVKVEEMTFPSKNIPPPEPEPKSDSIIDKVWGWLLII